MAAARSASAPPAALAAGFLPDVISSDVHALSVEGPAFDLVTMSKFLGLGMPLPEIVRAVTATPARLLGRPDLGTLAVGTTGDATVLEIEQGNFDQLDVTGASRRFDRRLRPRAVVLGGGLWHTAAGLISRRGRTGACGWPDSRPPG